MWKINKGSVFRLEYNNLNNCPIYIYDLPRTINIRDMSIFKKYYFTHRGLHKGEEIPENSLWIFPCYRK